MAAREAAAFFSGGVDSFYMVLKNREARSEAPPIGRLISMWGFDIPIEAAGEFVRLRARLVAAAGELGMKFLDVATNLRTTRFRETRLGTPWARRRPRGSRLDRSSTAPDSRDRGDALGRPAPALGVAR